MVNGTVAVITADIEIIVVIPAAVKVLTAVKFPSSSIRTIVPQVVLASVSTLPMLSLLPSSPMPTLVFPRLHRHRHQQDSREHRNRNP
jgi:hypothetical protein